MFDGIDSAKYTWESYPSVMNYNEPDCTFLEILQGCTDEAPLQFTEGEWEYIAENLDENAPEVDDYN